MIPVTNDDVSAVFASYPGRVQNRLLLLRETIFDVAAQTEGVGELEETLKWGQVSYLTPVTKSGSTIRIDMVKDNPGQIGMYFNCQTTLVETFRAMYADTFEFEGNRCIKFDIDDDIPLEAVRDCIAMALTYHRSKKQRKGV